MHGQDPNTVIATVHSNETGSQTSIASAARVTDTSGFHKYGVLWTEEEIVWYFDDAAIARADTPSDMHDAMYMLVNLAIGGMAGPPTDGLMGGAEMKVDYVKAYSLDADWHI